MRKQTWWMASLLALMLCGCPRPLPEPDRFVADAAAVDLADAGGPDSADPDDGHPDGGSGLDSQSSDLPSPSDAEVGVAPADAGCAVQGCGVPPDCQALTCLPDGSCASAPTQDGTPCGGGKSCYSGLCLADPPQAIRVVAGGDTTCVLLDSGAVACWGAGASGQLGTGKSGTGYGSAIALAVPGVSGATDLACGQARCCAVVGGGKVKCWGDNSFGGCSPGSAAAILATPVEVPGIAGAVAVAVGAGHSCAIVGSGKVKCWGKGLAGQLGDGTASAKSAPVEVQLGTGHALQIRAGLDHTCVRTAQGGAWCWGTNELGELGDGKAGPGQQATTPTAVIGIQKPGDLAAGHHHGCVLPAGGAVHCWGKNGSGQVGNGTLADAATAQTTGLAGVLQFAAGGDHTCAIVSGGGVWCWGANAAGQLAATGSPYPYLSKKPKEVVNFKGAVEVAAGTAHTCVRRGDGSVWCWGDNAFGQSGAQAGKLSVVPVQAY